MPLRKEAARRRDAAARLVANGILLAGDADEVLAEVRTGIREADIRLASTADVANPAGVVFLAITNERQQSPLAKAAALVHKLGPAIGPDAVVVVLIVRGAGKLASGKLRTLLVSEVLYQIALTVPDVTPPRRWGVLRRRSGRIALGAAGMQVLRVGTH